MNWPAHCAAVIPCLNEAATIGAIVQGARAHAHQVFVVDDGSTDATADESAKAGATVVSHRRNLGKGAALQTGLAAAREGGFVWAFTLDADGQHDPADMPRFYRAAEAGHAALVIGNRMPGAAAMSPVRRWANAFASRRLAHLTGLEVPDSQCGFRLLDLRVWAGLALCETRFAMESELLLAYARAGQQIAWVPVRCVAHARPSRIRPVRDTWRWLCWSWRSKSTVRKA